MAGSSSSARLFPAASRKAAMKRKHSITSRAGQGQTTVSGVLARELDGIASAHADELSAAIPGFADVLAWPEGNLRCGDAERL
jgi:hypothetical protein